MNGIHLNIPKITNTDPKENLFELRHKIYDQLIDQVYGHIDYLYDRLVNDQKAEDINKRTNKSLLDKESLIIMYKGVEIPMMNKTCIILDNIEYIPIFQMVDKPIHLQKNSKYIVVKNNIRNTYIKLDGKICNVLYKNATIPLLPYFLYIYPTVKDILKDFGYKIIEDSEKENINLDDDKYYFIPEYYDNTFIIVERDFAEGSWREYFLSPFTKDRFEFHQVICNNIIDSFNNELIPLILEDGKNTSVLEDITSTSVIDEEIEKNKKKKEFVNEKNIREYILLPHKTNQETLDKIYTILNTYHINTRTVKKNITKVYIESSLFKYTCKDITMNNVSIFDMIVDNIKNNRMIPQCYNISDISQKNLRFLEWYAMKLSSVRSYPEQDLIMEVAKTEPKRIYNNTVNPIAELSIMSRVNLFGKGAIPLEACNIVIRNLHDSYQGVVSSIDSPAGRNIGISLHLCPEVDSTDIEEEVNKLHDGNIFNTLYNRQSNTSTTTKQENTNILND